MIKRFYKRFLLWVLSPVLEETKKELKALECRANIIESQATSLLSEIAVLRSR